MISRILCSVAVITLLPTISLAEGLLYQLPEDGTWVRFEMNGEGTLPDGSETMLKGSVTLSSVGRVEVDGQKCRWIEIADKRVINRKQYTVIDKLLIPEKHLGKGKEPLSHVQKAWILMPLVEDKAREVKNLEEGFFHRHRPYLHGPFESPEELRSMIIDTDTQLGKLKSKGIRAGEKFERDGISINSTYTIRLNKNAPFGVVHWEVEHNVIKEGDGKVKMNMKLKLADYGTDAKSAIPEAE